MSVPGSCLTNCYADVVKGEDVVRATVLSASAPCSSSGAIGCYAGPSKSAVAAVTAVDPQ